MNKLEFSSNTQSGYLVVDYSMQESVELELRNYNCKSNVVTKSELPKVEYHTLNYLTYLFMWLLRGCK